MIKAFANAVHTHWGIENRLHWVLDVTFREDDCHIRHANAPAIFNTLTLIRPQPPPARPTSQQKKLKAAWDDVFRANVEFQQ